MTFVVNLERYSGPYDKIIELIENRKLLINELSLAKIADDYIVYVKSIQGGTLNNLSMFIVTASTLMLIKAKSLIPTLNYTEEEKRDVNILEKKLILYSTLLSASKHILRTFKLYASVTKDPSKINMNLFVPDKHLNTLDLQAIAYLTLMKLPKSEKLPKVAVKQTLKIENVIEDIVNKINVSNMKFSDYAKSHGYKNIKEVKVSLIVSFLAILELIKNGILDADQEKPGDDISLIKNQVNNV